ncbi:hypothetical protein [Thiocapsa rosea]|uniref:hypothetical protein n=1 Tax=Thiocapsa rosea TaxID=69360 RepID=UPI0011C4408E|nr:hypothetical protein [Thiocapsa rosea]
MLRTLCGLVGLSLTPVSTTAEPVSVNRKSGQGFAVSYRNNCYVLLPQHVHGTSPSLTLATGSPPIVGEAKVIERFDPGMDLSVAFVTGGLEGRCAPQWEDLPRKIDQLISPGGQVTFVTVSEGGVINRLPAIVELVSYEYMVIDLGRDVEKSIFQGRSGSVVLAGNAPVGMIVKTGCEDVIELPAESKLRADGKQGCVLRMDAIVDRARRLIERGSTDVMPPPLSPEPPESQELGLVGLAGRILTCSSEGAVPEAGCWSLEEGSGPLLIAPGDLPFSIVVELSGADATPVSRVRLASRPSSEGQTVPKNVIVDFNAGTKKRPNWKEFRMGDMTPFGDLDLLNGMAPRTRAVRLTIVDAWADGLPLQLDRIEVR